MGDIFKYSKITGIKMELEFISKKIKTIENELNSLKILVLENKKVVSLKGVLKGIKVDEKEIGEAKNSPFHLS